MAAANQNSSDEQKEVMRIATDYFMQEFGSEEKTNMMLQSLAKTITEDSAKLIHIGNVLFLVLVRGKGVVEVHTLGNEAQPRDLAKDFHQLAADLKMLGVKTAYTYTEDKRFSRLAKMTGLPFKELAVKVKGKPMTAYVLEL